MKKLVSLLLTVIMLISVIVVPVSAANEPEYAAPVVYGAQEKMNDDGTTFDIRFISIATSLDGKVFGYEISATYYDGTSGNYVNKIYSAAEGYANLETNVVYSSIFGKTAAYTVDALAAELSVTNAQGIFAVGLTNVPKNLDIVFEVNTYVKNSAGEIVARSDVKKGAYDQGEVADIKFYQNFNAVAGTSGGYQEFKALMNNATDVGATLTYTVSADGALTFTIPAGNVTAANILPTGAITSANYDKYIFEMEITIGTDWNPNNAGSSTLIEFGPVNAMNWSARANSLRLRANAGRISAAIADSGVGNSWNADVVMRGEKHRYKMVIDFVANTVTCYLDAEHNRTNTLTAAQVNGGFMMYLNHNANSGSTTYSVTLDNIVIKGVPKA